MDKSTQSPDVAALLAANPEAAHFLATLAQGTPLAEAVRDHFGPMLAAEAPEPDPPASEPEPAAAPAPAGEPAVPFAPPAAAADGDTSEAPAFLAYRRRSFWPDDFTL